MANIVVNSSYSAFETFLTETFPDLFTLSYLSQLDSLMSGLQADTLQPVALGSTLVELADATGKSIRFEGTGFGPITSTTNLTLAMDDLKEAISALNGSASGTLSRIVVKDGATQILNVSVSPTQWVIQTGVDKLVINGNLGTSLSEINQAASELLVNYVNGELDNSNLNTAYNPATSILKNYKISSVVASSNDVVKATYTYSPTGVTFTSGDFALNMTGNLPATMADLAKIFVSLSQNDQALSGYTYSSGTLTRISDGAVLVSVTGPLDITRSISLGTDQNDTIIFNEPDFRSNTAINLGAGNDSVSLVLEDPNWFYNDTLAINIDGGTGVDSVSYLGSKYGIRVGYYGVFSGNAQQYISPTSTGVSSSLTNIENITATNYNDVLDGTGYNNKLIGGGGSDTIRGLGGNDTIGGDSVVVRTANADAIERLYITTLGRGPDTGGLLDWTAQMDAGKTLGEIVPGFVNSAEFQAKYGALSNGAFVTLLYNNVFHRAPDQGGYDAWVNALNAGTTRADVVLGFSNSAELQASVEAETQYGQVYRLYLATLDREADAGGMSYWRNALFNNAGVDAVAAGFVNSAEFQSKYGALSNTDFVRLLYVNVLDREADAGGLSHWSGLLDGGASRTSVVLGFSESVEFKNNTQSGLKSYMGALGNRDIIEGGAGNDIMEGGVGVDTFVFRHGEMGTDTILHYEAWDQVQFIGYGYASEAAAKAHMVESGNNVVFTDFGLQTITFEGAKLSDISVLI